MNEQYRPKEDVESECFAAWLDANELKHCHISHEGEMDIRYAMKLQRKGKRPGLPDHLVIIPEEKSNENRPLLLFIEMKRERKILKNGKFSKDKSSGPSDEQREWIKCLRTVSDVEAIVCYGSDEAEQFINIYLK